MRLLDSHTQVLVVFPDESQIPRYAILSHTWGTDEVTFDDVKNRPLAAKKKKSCSKIFNTCRLAAKDGYQYAWIDTCCIDKSSSAELSEAINSMFRWYQGSKICYVYLSDALESCRSMDDLNDPANFDEERCRWFSRCWTLQELIAPNHVRLYNRSWLAIGHLREGFSLIAGITGIDTALLRHSTKPIEFSVAMRFSWAANRSTTRVEDEAYSLVGLFDVNMPLLYGEGRKAFVRLQEEIIKASCDLDEIVSVKDVRCFVMHKFACSRDLWMAREGVPE